MSASPCPRLWTRPILIVWVGLGALAWLPLAQAAVTTPGAAPAPAAPPSSEPSVKKPGGAGATSATPSPRPSTPAGAAGSAVASQAQFKTEEQWIVDSVARDLLSYAAFLALGPGAGTKHWEAPTLSTEREGAAFALRWKLGATAPEQTAVLKVPLCVWLPEMYSSWAAGILPPKLDAAAAGPAAAPDGGLVAQLLTPTAAVQMRENQRVSQWLAKAPANPAAHEEAALLLASLGLREGAGIWSERRRLISRVTAHLALASALRGPAGTRTDAGALAETWLYLTLQRSDDTLKRIASLRSHRAPGVQQWLNALEMGQTGDWRLCHDPAHASLLEQEHYISELALNTTVARALDFFASQPALRKEPDPYRECLRRNFRIAAGHFLTRDALNVEMAEIRTLSSKEKLEELVHWLNLPLGLPVEPDSAGHPVVRVIDPGMWAGYSQRHLLYTMDKVHSFLRMVGARKSQPDFVQDMEPLVKGLRLGPTAQALWVESREEYDAIKKDLCALPTEHPESIGPALWLNQAAQFKRWTDAAAGFPAPNAWFDPPVPRGCMQTSGARSGLPAARNRAWLEAAHAINPRENSLAMDLVAFRREDAATAAKTYGVLGDYALQVMLDLAARLRRDPAAYQRQMLKACEIDPAQYMKLGRYLAEHLMSEDAAAAFEKGVATAPDPVDMANECQWLVNWYFEKGRIKEALALAKRADATQSARGIWTEAYLHEQMGDLKSAYEILQKVQENWETDTYLVLFCGRHRNDPAHPEFASIYEAGLEKRYPESARRVTLQDFKGRPTWAARMGETLPASLLEAGLEAKAAVVAVNGCPCNNINAYHFLRDSAPAPTFEVIVWQNEKYETKTVKTKPPLLNGYAL